MIERTLGLHPQCFIYRKSKLTRVIAALKHIRRDCSDVLLRLEAFNSSLAVDDLSVAFDVTQVLFELRLGLPEIAFC